MLATVDLLVYNNQDTFNYLLYIIVILKLHVKLVVEEVRIYYVISIYSHFLSEICKWIYYCFMCLPICFNSIV